MSRVTIYADDTIAVDGSMCWHVRQEREGTRVWRKSRDGRAVYEPIELPRNRYSLATDRPASGNPGRADFERDFLAAIGQ